MELIQKFKVVSTTTSIGKPPIFVEVDRAYPIMRVFKETHSRCTSFTIALAIILNDAGDEAISVLSLTPLFSVTLFQQLVQNRADIN
jgi:hypothetical protein